MTKPKQVKAMNNKQDIDKPAEKRSFYSLDDHYSELFLDNPTETHTTLYKEACKLADVPVSISPRQAAYELHKRLQSNLNKLLIQQSDNDKALGRSVLRKLTISASSESVKAQCAGQLAKGLYPDVVEHVEPQTLEELQEESKLLDEQLREISH